MRGPIQHILRRSLSTALSLLVVAGLLLRPAQLDAILIHSHGEAGEHVHLLDKTELGIYEREHDRLHELEHADHESAVHEHDHDHGHHSEDCGAILVVFGDGEAAKASARDAADSHQHDRNFGGAAAHASIHCCIPDNAAVEFFARPRANHAADSPLDSILQSNHAILI